MELLNILFGYGFTEFHSNPRMDTFYVYTKGYYPFILRMGRDHEWWYGETQVQSEQHVVDIYAAIHNDTLIKD